MSTNPQFTQQNLTDSDKRFRGTVISSTIIVLSTIIAALMLDLIHGQLGRTILMVTVALISISLFFALYKNILLPARIFTPTAVFSILTYFLNEGEGVRDATIIGFPVIAILAGLLLGEKGAIVFGVLTTLAVATVGYAEFNGYLVTPVSAFLDSRDAAVFWILNLATALITAFLIRRLSQAADAAKKSEEIQLVANKELNTLKNTLEEQVDERTSKLASTAQELENRAQQLQAIADVSKTIALVKNLKELLPTITQQISRNFDFYHVGIFFLDEAKEYATLQAANSSGGEKMLERGHRLAVGQVGLIGSVAQDRQARIALDVGADAAYFDNPDLPETRSEMVLPLLFGNQIIGILDVQSKQEAVFTEEDTKVFSTLANQVAIAIENARQAEITQVALEKAEELARQYVRQEWSRVAKTQQQLGYRYADGDISVLSADKAQDTTEKATLDVPVKLRGETIGIFKIHTRNAEQEFNPEDMELIQAIADRAAIAMENVRLLEDSQRRASRESIIGDISTKISAGIDIEAILRVAAEELGHRLRTGGVTIELTDTEFEPKVK